jgi:hypothetical protein
VNSIDLSELTLAERTPVVDALLKIIDKLEQENAELKQSVAKLEKTNAELSEQVHQLKKENQGFKDEIARLKKHKTRPKLRPSQLEQPKKEDDKGKRKNRKGKRKKTAELTIHETVQVAPKESIPDGSRFRGYDEYTIVGLKFEPYNVRYQLAIWETPEGKRLKGQLPRFMEILGGHFTPELVSYVVHQHHHGRVPQGLIWEQLVELGVDISEGQINRILSVHAGPFHAEKEEVLQVGLEVSPYIHADDTGARHQGKNGYCTHIGNQWFAYFASTASKSRINFLKILRAGHTDYVVNDDAIEYMEGQRLPKDILKNLGSLRGESFADDAAWQQALKKAGVTRKRHRKITTEGALLGSVLCHGIYPDLVIMSDDAGQFNVLLHALCWIHAERTLAKLVGFTDAQREVLERKRTEVWDYYRALKAYCKSPSISAKQSLMTRFDAMFTEQTCFVSLNLALGRLHKNKDELLVALERPYIPLHNNLSENDIREYVMRRKCSGSTRSEEGRRCRDTYVSLKKTCRKLGISFWHYLLDRFSGSHKIPKLADLIRQRAAEVTN